MARKRTHKTRAASYFFDQEIADNVERFFELMVTHPKAEWAGQPLVLEQWQIDWVHELLCWRNSETGFRRYSEAYLEIPRKNGKTTFVAGLSWWFLRMDNEPGAEVYTCASDKGQAGILFNSAKIMAENVPELGKGCEIWADSIVEPDTHSFHKVLSAEAYSKHGMFPSCVLMDELHAQPNRDLYDVMRTGQGARRQPMFISITTAGHDRKSICWEVHQYAEKVRDGVIEDDTFFPRIYAADQDDDWTDEKTWHKANPNLGVSVKLSYLRKECEQAKAIPARENTFRQLYLNQWTEQASRWLALAKWDACLGPIPWKRMGARPCYAALDLGLVNDLAALALVFPPLDEEKRKLYRVGLRCYIPEESVAERVKRDKVPYDQWIKQGWMIETPGEVTDYDAIELDITENVAPTYQLLELAADPWTAQQMLQRLDKQGLTVFPHRQGFVSMAEPCRDVERAMLKKSLRHDGNPVLRWSVSNAVVRKDPSGNLKPDKDKSQERIDPLVALTMALGRAMLNARAKEESVYAKRGIRSVELEGKENAKRTGNAPSERS